MVRHLAFERPEELHRFVAQEAPRHLYHSTAYFGRPDAPTMNEKEWLGADLVFDLDADHLRNAQELSYPDQLRKAKDRYRALLDDFVFGDFGFDPSETLLTFSGGRGYHAHLRSRQLLGLSSAERRELVDYILGIGVDPLSGLTSVERRDSRVVIVGSASGSGAGRGPTPLPRFAHLVSPTAAGWPGRISRAVTVLLDRWKREGLEVAERELSPFLDSSKAHRAARALLKKERSEQIRENRSLDVFSQKMGRDVLEALLRLAMSELQGETDAPVTPDVHRLIRWPGSLHGGTGLRVLPLSRDTLDAFDPLRDAPVRTPDAPMVSVEFGTEVGLAFGSGRIDSHAGDVKELEPAAAMFCLLRGEARLAAAQRPPGR